MDPFAQALSIVTLATIPLGVILYALSLHRDRIGRFSFEKDFMRLDMRYFHLARAFGFTIRLACATLVIAATLHPACKALQNAGKQAGSIAAASITSAFSLIVRGLSAFREEAARAGFSTHAHK